MPKTKTVYQLNIDGYFTGTTTAHESPREPDVYLIPRNAIEQEPPTFSDNERAKWNGSSWSIEEIPVEVEPESDPLTVEELQDSLISQIESLFNQATQNITSHYPQAERETWYKQELEAKAYLNDSNADTSFISKLATKRGISLDDMVTTILGKIDHYEDVISTAMEKRRKLLHKVNEELTLLEDLQNFNVQEEWDKM